MEGNHPDNEHLHAYEEINEPSLLDLLLILYRYRGILLATALVFVILAIGASGMVITSTEKQSSLVFRLDFAGAQSGRYPNGRPSMRNMAPSTPSRVTSRGGGASSTLRTTMANEALSGRAHPRLRPADAEQGRSLLLSVACRPE